jgi:hypothetical protein
MEPEIYRPITLLNDDYELPARILANRMRRTLSTVIRPGKYCGVSSITMFNAIAVIRDSLPLAQFNPYPTAFPYGNGMVLHFYQQQESSTTKIVYKVINKGLKTYV